MALPLGAGVKGLLAFFVQLLAVFAQRFVSGAGNFVVWRNFTSGAAFIIVMVMRFFY